MRWLFLWLLATAPVLAADPPAPPASAEPSEDRATWDAVRWISEVDARAASLPGLRYSARRTTTRGELTVEERWRFVLWQGDHFRVDYFGDTARQITCDGHVMLDYVPAAGRAMRWNLDSLAGDERRTMLGRVLEKVAVPGLRLGHAQDVAWTLAHIEHDGRPAVRLDGVGRDDTRLSYVIDEERVAVLAMQIHQSGTMLLDSRSQDHREVHPGVWVPHQVDLSTPDQGGTARVALRLTKVAAVTDAPTDLFTTTLDPSIPIEERP